MGREGRTVGDRSLSYPVRSAEREREREILTASTLTSIKSVFKLRIVYSIYLILKMNALDEIG
jgi:hypothetical protein